MQTHTAIAKPIFRLLEKLYQIPFIRFITIGAIGLCSDASFLYALRHVIGLIPAKIVSYIVAVIVTWILNRYFTFSSKDPRRLQQLLRYIAVYFPTGCLHVAIFAGLTHEFLFLHDHPIVPLIMTAVIITLINFTLAQRFAFRILPA